MQIPYKLRGICLAITFGHQGHNMRFVITVEASSLQHTTYVLHLRLSRGRTGGSDLRSLSGRVLRALRGISPTILQACWLQYSSSSVSEIAGTRGNDKQLDESSLDALLSADCPWEPLALHS